jgi:hypothetical protein
MRIGFRKAALACGAAGLALAATVPSALAANGDWHYASFDFAGQNVSAPAADFPPAQITTDSTAPSQTSDQSAFLNDATPFGRAFGSSQGQPYALLRPAKGRDPSTTVMHFDRSLVPGTWGFALGGVDAEKVRVTAYDAAGNPVPTPALGFQGSFDYCQAGPLPTSCLDRQGADEPVWDSGSSTLVGPVDGTAGASGWFRPTAEVASLELYAVVQSGLPVYQLWLAADDQPATEFGLPVGEPVRTAPGQDAVIPVCEGASTAIDLISGGDHGLVASHPDCAVTYTPEPGFTGEDSITLRIGTADGRVLVRTFAVKVAAMLPDTGMPADLASRSAAALALLGTGAALTTATRKARKA